MVIYVNIIKRLFKVIDPYINNNNYTIKITIEM
jgi:hypothetical protein